MKLRKIISNILAIGLLFNSGISSFAGVLSEDGRYETFEGNNITINDVLEEDTVNIGIEGNTLVNLANNITSRGVWSDIWGYIKVGQDMLIENKIYTVSLENLPIGFQWVITNNAQTVYYTPQYTTNSTELMSSDIPYEELVIHINNEGNSEVTQEQIDKINVLILEGDWTNKEISKYFEGLESSFENQLITQEMIDSGLEKQENLGKYKVEVKSTGKNKFDGQFVDGMISDSTGVLDSNHKQYKSSINYTHVKSNTAYTIANNVVDTVFAYDKNYNYLGYYFKDNLSASKTFVTFENCEYIKIRYQPANASEEAFQIEEGSVATEYEPYKESITKLYLKEPLRGLPNGVKDRIIKRNGQWVVERNCGEIILNGSEQWLSSSINTPTRKTITFYSNIIGKSVEDMIHNEMPNIKSDTFIVNSWDAMGISDIESVSISGTEDVGVTVNKVKLDSIDIDGFKKWLSENPIKVIYKLKTPTYEPLNIDPTINTYLDTTHISNNSNIPATMEITVDRTLNRATEAIELMKSNPTVANIERARMWSNLLKESAKKDDLHNQINNITNIEDLEIEKKTVSANMDLYIKSQNSLSMSLSTNSIIFDEFSGVEDMEKLNAVDITINSSLPYQLNSYLESEIKNTDNSKIIPKELLNIRLNGETDYKAFSNINEKLVLKKNCDKGNNNIFGVDLILKGDLTHRADIYKTTIKFEAEQK